MKASIHCIMNTLPPELIINIGCRLSLKDWAIFTRTTKLINCQSIVWNTLLVQENPDLNIWTYNLNDQNMWVKLLTDKFKWTDELFIRLPYISQPKLLYSVYRTLIVSPHNSLVKDWNKLVLQNYENFPRIIEQIFELNLYHKKQSFYEIKTKFTEFMRKVDSNVRIGLTKKLVGLLNYISQTMKIPYEKIFPWERRPLEELLHGAVTDILINMIRFADLHVVKTLIENLDHSLLQCRRPISILNVALGFGLSSYYEGPKKDIFEYLLEGKYFLPDIDTLYYTLIDDNFPDYLDKIINNFSDQDIWQVISRFIASSDGEYFTNWNEEGDSFNLRLNNLAKLFSRIDLVILNVEDKVWTVLYPALLAISPLVQILLNNLQFQSILSSRSSKELIAMRKLIKDNSDLYLFSSYEYRSRYINLLHQLCQFITNKIGIVD